jgi:phosphoribosyl 1,2-cyclic phosphate phosphodiesterase
VGEPPDSKLARNADVLVVDGSTRDRPGSGHMAMTETLELLPKLKPGRTLFTHVGHRTGMHAELEEWLGDRAGVAHDGLEIEF